MRQEEKMGPILQELSSASPLRVVMFLTVLTVLPGIILCMTAFLRILVVLGFLRNAMGLNQMPPTQVLIGISLFLTYLVMGPQLEKVYFEGVEPYLAGTIDETEALKKASEPLREFMLLQTRNRDLALVLNLAESPPIEKPEDVPMRVAVPAFILSELRTAFSIGFLLFVPFLVIELAVAALLNALGMIMVQPTAISLPFKLMVFVLADGWSLLVASLVRSLGGGG